MTIDVSKISRAMSELNFSTYMLAAATGVKQPTVASILAGRSVPAADKLTAICEALDLEIEEVLVEELTA